MALKNESSIPDEVRAKAAHANGKMKPKVYEKELHKLQVELAGYRIGSRRRVSGSSSCSKDAMPRARGVRSRLLPSG